MNESEIKKIFLEKQALLEGHFQLTSGLHSDSYMQCSQVLQHPHVAEVLGEALAQMIREENAGVPVKVDVVCSPAIGGIVLGHVVARAFNARAIFAERENGAGPLILRRGFSLAPGESVLAVEDVITTGGSLKEIVQLVQNSGAKLMGVASLLERSVVPVSFGSAKTILLKLPLRTFQKEDCPMCKQGTPAVKPGSRKS